MWGYVFNPKTWEAMAGVLLQVQGQTWLNMKIQLQ